MKDNYFIDTNIFPYVVSDKDLTKQLITKEIVLQPFQISTQIINESLKFLKN